MTSALDNQGYVARQVADHIQPLAMPLPEGCSDSYAAGWAIADMSIARGEGVSHDVPLDWLEDKARGYRERIAAEDFREARPAETIAE
ncbi:TPA: hypothetical protein SL557_000069 [Pseudomonas aeruginosa]|uniref:hypothetical protein n=1 Tax=Pseudomonas aeruginosa TaxID=287 RepID=UPI00115DF44F|nr:hypothetical protein [Pseudomonas aeruginosa]HEJ4407791.1 hypothetical protein [Pseudomonas aeruginosa]